MLDWPMDSAQWTYCLLGVAALTALALLVLASRTGRAGNAGWFTDVVLPGSLAAAVLYFLPSIMAAFGIGQKPYLPVLEGLAFRSLWLGTLLDQSSWVERTTAGLRGRRGSLPVWLCGGGFLVLMLAPLASHFQNDVLKGIDQMLNRPANPDANLGRFASLTADWGLAVADLGVALTLVGATALAAQSLLWAIRIGHAYLFTQAVEPDSNVVPPYAPGCFQCLFGFFFGIGGAAWLVWATYSTIVRA